MDLDILYSSIYRGDTIECRRELWPIGKDMIANELMDM